LIIDPVDFAATIAEVLKTAPEKLPQTANHPKMVLPGDRKDPKNLGLFANIGLILQLYHAARV
jgi:hypothetical protein